jgi:hypothetical protein
MGLWVYGFVELENDNNESGKALGLVISQVVSEGPRSAECNMLQVVQIFENPKFSTHHRVGRSSELRDQQDYLLRVVCDPIVPIHHAGRERRVRYATGLRAGEEQNCQGGGRLGSPRCLGVVRLDPA